MSFACLRTLRDPIIVWYPSFWSFHASISHNGSAHITDIITLLSFQYIVGRSTALQESDDGEMPGWQLAVLSCKAEDIL